jgi:hypothetical protein
MTTVTITLTVPSNQATVASKLRLVPGFSPEAFAHLASYFDAIAGGPYSGRAVVTVGALPSVTVYNGF